jgi:hypothetical protein
MSDGVWVEVAFTGDVSMDTAERFVCDVDDYAKRYGLQLATGAASSPESGWPGTPLMLDCAIQQLAGEWDMEPAEVQRRLEDEARQQLTQST